MYGMDTHTTVKTLLFNGISRRKIAEQLGIHRRVIKRIERDLADESGRVGYHREKLLAGSEQLIKNFLAADLTAGLIHQKLVKEHSLSVSYATVSRFVRKLKADVESFVPMPCFAGEEVSKNNPDTEI
jgi:transposase